MPFTNLLFDYTPKNGPTAAVPNPGAIGLGLVDRGGVYLVSASNQLSNSYSGNAPWNGSALVAETITSANGEVKFRITPSTGTYGADGYAFLRVLNPGSTPTAYLVGISGGAPSVYTVVAGTLTLVSSGTLGGTLTPGTSYDYVATATQSNGTTSAITFAVYQTSGTQVGSTYSVNDTTSALQNTSGAYGIVSATPLSRIQIYNDQSATNATSYTFTPPSSLQVGNTYSIPVTLVGGNVLTASLVVSVTASSGTVTNSPVTIASGSVVGYFSYTPSAAGVITFTATHTGGNNGMSDPGVMTSTSTLVVVMDANNPCTVMSPYGWDYVSGPAGSARTFYGGQYARYYFKGCTSATLLLDGTQSQIYYQYSIDNGPLTAAAAPTGSGQVSVTIPDTGSHSLNIWTLGQPTGAGLWGGTAYFGLLGLQLGSGGSVDPQNTVRYTKIFMDYGDSITMGVNANDGLTAFTYSSAYTVGQALFTLGFEYGAIPVSALGYTQNLAPANNVPPVYTVGNDTNSSWNKINQSVSRLVGGVFSPQPTIIYDNYGQNDMGSSTLLTAVPAFYTALRAAAPNALLIKAIPYTGTSRANILTAIRSYITSSSDTNIRIVDLNIDTRLTGGSYTGFGDTTHPGRWGHSNIGPLVLAQILAAYFNQPLPNQPSAPAHAVVTKNFTYGSTAYRVGDSIYDPNYTLIAANPFYSKFYVRVPGS